MNQPVRKIIALLIVVISGFAGINQMKAQEGDFTVRIKQPAVSILKSCPDKNIIFQAEGLNEDGSTFDVEQAVFTWDVGYDGQNITGAMITYAYPEGGHYKVRLYVTGSEGQAAQNVPELDIFVAMKPSFTGTRSDQLSFCSGAEITLTGFAYANPWTGDDSTFTNTYQPGAFVWEGAGIQTDHHGVARVLPPLNLGHQEYIFRVEDDFACFHDTTLTLYGVYAEYEMDPITGEAPLDVTFKVDTVSNGGSEDAVSYEWQFYELTDTSNLLISTEEVFSFERPGQYYTRMIARDQQCTFEFSHQEYIRVDSSLLEVPNVFSPNEDGANDYFQVHSRSLRSFHGKIFNRWGRLVYEWTEWKTPEDGWNGRYQNTGKPAPVGTYYYIITAVGHDDVYYPDEEEEDEEKGKEYRGFLTLIR